LSILPRRLDRINELLLREISRIVLERQHPDVGFVTFTGVDATDDLMEAKVFYSVLGSEEEKERTARALEHIKADIMHAMRKLPSLKHIPHFHFIYDDTPSRAARVHEILGRIQEEPPVPPLPDDTDADETR
jgi:ribosome-binding factor A